MKIHELGEVFLDNSFGDFLSQLLVVGMASQCSATYHVHPYFTIFNHPSLECQAKHITTAVQVCFSLRFKIILNHIPGKLKSVFK